jgi:hypothetical protein
VTKPFYKGGWHGVNIEPLRSKFDLFERERPRDVNLSLVGWRSRGWRKPRLSDAPILHDRPLRSLES